MSDKIETKEFNRNYIEHKITLVLEHPINDTKVLEAIENKYDVIAMSPHSFNKEEKVVLIRNKE